MMGRVSRTSGIVSRREFSVRIGRMCDWLKKHSIEHMDVVVTKTIRTVLGHRTPERSEAQ